jgi:hypothetical protein
LEVEVELVLEFDVDVVEVAAMTQGETSSANAMAIPTAAVSCAVLVFILSSMAETSRSLFTGFPRMLPNRYQFRP